MTVPATPDQKDAVIAIFGAAVGLAGILLVFVGFIYSRVETFDLARAREKYRLVAKLGILPFLLSLAAAWVCLNWFALPTDGTYLLARHLFQGSMVLTALYGLVALVFYL